MGFVSGLKVFFSALSLCFSKQHLWAWYKKIALKSLAISIVILVLLLIAGSMGLTKLIAAFIAESLWASLAVWAVNILWVVAVIYFSGTITSSLLMALVGVLFDEKRLMQHFCGRDMVWTKAKRGDHIKEYWAIFVSIAISIFTLLWFFIPILIPFAILLNAWAMGRESLALANRVWHQAGHDTLIDKQQSLSWSYVAGLGAVSSAILLIPVLGWMFLPVLQVAGVEALKDLTTN